MPARGEPPSFQTKSAPPANGAAAGLLCGAVLTVTAQPNTKVYDGTMLAATLPTISDLAPGDSIGSVTEVYDSLNAGQKTFCDPLLLSFPRASVMDSPRRGSRKR